MLTRRRNSSASESKQEVVYQSGLQHSTTQGTSKYLQHYIDQIPEQATSDFEMTCRDRSHEFMSAVKLLQPRQVKIVYLLDFSFSVTNIFEMSMIYIELWVGEFRVG